MIMRFLLSICILWSTSSFSLSLNDNLACLNEEILKAEFWALNCVMIAQKNKSIISDCPSAERSVRSIDKQLMKVIDELTLNSAEEGPAFYTALDQIKQFRKRLQKINTNLSIAKKVSGVYNWNNKIYPSYYMQQ